jgi:uncharacterized membrane protein YedE/YeeE
VIVRNAATWTGLASGYPIGALAADAAGLRTAFLVAAAAALPAARFATLGQRWLNSPSPPPATRLSQKHNSHPRRAYLEDMRATACPNGATVMRAESA